MKSRLKIHFLLGPLLLLALLSACQDEEAPTAVPTSVAPVELPTAVPTTPATDSASDEATAVPETNGQPVAVDRVDWPPQVIDSSPLPNESLTLDGAITVRFDQPMDPVTVEDAFSVVNEAEATAVSGDFAWPRPDTVLFTPRSDLSGKQLYRVRIEESAAGTNGLTMPVPVELRVQSAGAPAVNQVIPEDGAQTVDTAAAVTVMFNRPIVPVVGTAQQAELPQPLQFSPAVAGTGEWTSSSIYRFVPDPALAGATDYTVTVDPALTDVVGAVLEAPFSWSFSTMAPDVVTVFPEETASIAPDVTITVTFNMPMDLLSTEAAISLSGEEESADLLFNWTADGRAVGLTPVAVLELESAYELNVAASARAASGQASLNAPATFSYNTQPFPGVIGVYPRAQTTAEYYDRGVSIQFASPMAWETVEDRVQIFPAPVTSRTFINQFANEMQIDFPLEPDTSYTVVVPSTAADPYGNTLGAPFTWEFDTPGLPPIASFNLPPNVSLLSTSIVNEVDIIHSNVGLLDVELYELGLALNLLNRPYDVNDFRPATAPVRTWEIPIDGSRNDVGLTTLPLADGGVLDTGIYLLSMTSPDITDESRWWQNQSNLLIIADTNVVVKEMFGDVHVWVTDIDSGQPVSGRNLALYSQQGVELGQAVSDEQGFARFDYYPVNDFLEGVTVVSNSPGEEGFGAGNSRWDGGTTPGQLGLYTTSQDETGDKVYLYTDRPIYRPGDTLYFKGVARQGHYGRYDLAEQVDVDLMLRFNSFFSDDGFEQRLAATVRPDGTFNGLYELPADMPLGSYQLVVESPLVDYQSSRGLTVAEYRRPEFIVGLTPAAPETLRGEATSVLLEAEYFFGGSAADLPVQWSASDMAYFPDFPGPAYCWTDCGGFNFDGTNPFPFGGGFGSYLADGSGQTDADGQFAINLAPELLQSADPGSRLVTVEASVQDVSNFPIASRTEIVMHAAETYVGIKSLNGFAGAGEEMTVEVKTVDWEGAVEPGRPVEVVFVQREWEPVRSQVFGSYYTAWETNDIEVAQVALTTGEDGLATATFTPEAGGSYLAVATVRDKAGHINLSSTSLWVTDDGRIAWQVDPQDRSMDLVTDQDSYNIGETARVLVQNPFTTTVQAWLTLERGNLLAQQVISLDANSDILEIPITEDFSPNAFVTLTAVKPVTPQNRQRPQAEVRLGAAELVVPPDSFSLNVTLTPRSELLQPRETAVFDLETTRDDGTPLAADLSLALVDLAVLTLQDDNAPAILDYFYERQPYRSQVGGGLFISAEGLEPEIPLQGGGGGGGGDGAFAESAPALTGDDDGDVRRDFPDTAYWEANVTTDENGRAIVEIPLPDTLTTWRLHGKANTSDTLVGQNSVDIVTTLPLLIRPVTPRFMTVGDTLQLGAVINNNTDGPIESDIRLEAEGVVIDGAETQSVTVPANGQVLVRWPVVVADAVFVDGEAFADLTFRVEGGGFSDATKPGFGVGPDKLIPIVRFNGQDVVGTSGELDEAGRLVEALLLPPGVDMDQGSVDMVLSPSLAAALLDSLALHNNLDSLPTCAGSVADQLLPNVAVATLLERVDVPALEAAYRTELDVVIESNIARLSQLTVADGGWSWCSGSESDPWLTAYAALGLTKARQIGYDVSNTVLENAGAYLVAELDAPGTLRSAAQANEQAFYLYVLAEMGADVRTGLDDLVAEARGLLDPYAKSLLLLAYQRLAPDSANVATLLSDLNDTAVLSATGAHWEDAVQDYANLSSDIRGTAMAIQALAMHDADSLLAPPAVRWLMVARTAGRWPTAHENAWSIFGLAEWLAATGELEADYDYGLQVNLQPVADGRFTAESITDSRLVTVPVPGLIESEPNYFEIRRGDGPGRLYYTLHMNTAVAASALEPIDRGIRVERTYYDAACDLATETCEPIKQIAGGQQVRVVLTIQTENDLLYPVIEDPIPAGAEAVDPGLNTTLSEGPSAVPFDYQPGYWGYWFFNRVEYRDDMVVFLSDFLPAGTYQYSYLLNTVIPGDYQVMPTFAREDYFPEVNGRAAGLLFTIEE